jgi:hypothetical protein
VERVDAFTSANDLRERDLEVGPRNAVLSHCCLRAGVGGLAPGQEGGAPRHHTLSPARET